MREFLIFLFLIGNLYTTVPYSFFVEKDGSSNCLIVVGESADASDIIEASRLAAVIGELSARQLKLPIVSEESVTYENVPPGSCIVVTPSELSTLWYFDDFGVYGNGNTKFDPWETHEEIQLYIEDIKELDPFLKKYTGDGYLDFSTIYRIDNVRGPPLIFVYSRREGFSERVTGLHYEDQVGYLIVDPFFVGSGYLPEMCLFDKEYTVLYIDSSALITGMPHLDYVYVYVDEPLRIGEFTISVLDVDVDHNKCYLEVRGPYFREAFWMVLDPRHGFSHLQKRGTLTALDYNDDGVVDYVDKEIPGTSELDVWGHSLFSFRSAYGIADLVIDGIKIFIGEKKGVHMGVYWVEDLIIWPEMECCDPFVKYPQTYDFQIRPERVVVSASEDSYVDESMPLSNFGGSTFLSVRSFQNANTRSFVKFTLPELPPKAIVTRALLRLVPTSAVPRVYEVSRVQASWNESTITWANQPPALVTGTQINAVMEWDVTADVLNFYSGTPNYGWRISDQSENSLVPYETLFGSSEFSGLKPQLILEYTFDCNYLLEVIPHDVNWIGTFYDDVTADGFIDPVYEIDISLCEMIRTVCDPLFFEGPNYYYAVDFTDVSFATGVDFTVLQKEKVGEFAVEEIKVHTWELIKLDTEVTEEDGEYNWILIGGSHVNKWVKALVDLNMMPDDGSPVEWFLKEAGYKMYSDPFGFKNRILVVAGSTAKETQKAVEMLIEDIKK